MNPMIRPGFGRVTTDMVMMSMTFAQVVKFVLRYSQVSSITLIGATSAPSEGWGLEWFVVKDCRKHGQERLGYERGRAAKFDRCKSRSSKALTAISSCRLTHSLIQRGVGDV